MVGLVVLDFGGPQGAEELRPFLANLLHDVLPGPRRVRDVLAPALARARAERVRPQYEAIGWSPLVPTHQRQVEALRGQLGDELPPMASAMMYTPPTHVDAVRTLRDQGVDRLIALPMFPHYSFATTQSAFAMLHEALVTLGCADLPVRWVPAFFDHPAYLEALAATIREGIAGTGGPDDEPVHLLFTPHGLPVSFLRKGDPYADQVRETVRRVIAHLGWTGPYHVGWQSRLGPVRWLEPATPTVIDALARQGAQRLCFVPISFASEHIETLYEIDVEYRQHALDAGVPHVGRAPALGLQPAFVRCLADLVREARADLERYQCMRCLLDKTDAHRRRPRCPNCGWELPPFLRQGVTTR